MRKKILLGVAFLILFSKIDLYSQNINPENFINYNEVLGKTPTVAQFLRYDELPVSEYTGIPNITIPLYNIEVDDVKIPLTLSYHAGGIKVTQEASWVGLGWDIPAFASVTQIVKDEDDLLFYTASHNYNFYPDWRWSSTPVYSMFAFYNCWGLHTYGNIFEQQPIYNVTKQFGYFISTRGYVPYKGRYVHKDTYLGADSNDDSEPDIFKININGETLNCIVDRDAQTSNPRFIVLNKKGYVVNYTKANNEWEIIDPKGTKYYFNTKSEQNNLTMNRTYNMQSAVWYINRIVTTKGKEIKFNYTQAGKFVNTYKTSAKSIQVSLTPKSYFLTQYLDYMSAAYSQHPAFNSKIGHGYQPLHQIEEHQFYLQSIEFPFGKIEFSLSARTDISGKRKLDAITVKNKANQQVRGISFSYAYYSGQDTWSKKLKLNAVQIAGETPYLFTYNTTTLPAMNSYAVDYWGYYNGNTNNQSLAPNPLRFPQLHNYTHSLNENSEPEVTKNNHSARLQYAKAGILEKIQYPTGGKTVFDYELNEFTNYWVPDYESLTNVISKGNGLRVKEIKYLDADDGILKQEYYSYYGGKISQPINFFQSLRYRLITNIIDVWLSHATIWYNEFELLICSNTGNYSDNPLSSFNGVGYDKVVKTTIGTNNNTNGQIATFYHNYPDLTGILGVYTDGGTPRMSLPSIKNAAKPANGLAYKKVYYNSQGNKVSQETFEYLNKESALYYGVKIGGFSSALKNCMNFVSFYGRYALGYYPIFDFESLLTDKTDTQYYGNDSIVYYETYSYNSNNLLKTVFYVNSNTKHRNIYYDYPQDYTGSIYTKMRSNNMLATVIAKKMLRYNGAIIESRRINYTDVSSVTNGLILPESEEIFFFDTQGNHTLLAFNKYDSKGNILQITDNKTEITTTYLWGYNCNYPIAAIENASYSVVCSVIGNGNEQAGKTLLEAIANKTEPTGTDFNIINNLRTQLPNALVTTYTHKPLVGRLSETAPNGLITYYEYDNFGRLKLVKDHLGNILQQHAYKYGGQ